MNNEEKLEFIKNLLGLPVFSLKEETDLNDVETWDMDAMINFQSELSDLGKEIAIEELEQCERVIELLRLLD